MANRPLNSIPPSGVLAGDWAQSGGGLQADHGRDHLVLRDAQPQVPLLAAVRDAVLRGAGSEAVEGMKAAQLQQLALWTASSVAGVDVALSGARLPAHLETVREVGQWPRIGEETVWRIFDEVLDVIEEMQGQRRVDATWDSMPGERT
jgi:hypothetical protein